MCAKTLAYSIADMPGFPSKSAFLSYLPPPSSAFHTCKSLWYACCSGFIWRSAIWRSAIHVVWSRIGEEADNCKYLPNRPEFASDTSRSVTCMTLPWPAASPSVHWRERSAGRSHSRIGAGGKDEHQVAVCDVLVAPNRKTP